ncbi:FecCD family ABC transporter permease [Buchananella hordeovulneris]|uniref:FecCD family ABC transporter permease n=1 Tax=Buchananella hordeovulneris TaxID=52770 RepID=UPI000F5E795B|nr:iron chelate uptake ABC transporter family permease subunit [Buchananella hordeovulneris]MDO5080423.1 iron chelate uptake ABC transporter family permease subunit [Buchananella hordeovulneris]RRD45079.1 iron ABC transporter permease [Buchananella hordeovulneris]RRD52615.1 iron ABC transporter permease [Buchananella hordeovulneris]
MTTTLGIEPGRRARRRRYLLVTCGLGCLAIALWWTMLLYGDQTFHPGQALAVLRGEQVRGASYIIGEVRLPKAILGLAAGAAFGLAGATSQTLLRNQLASPDLIGISSGASAAAVFAILVLGWSGMRVNLLAVACGLATALLIYLLAGRGSALGGRLILIGIGIAAMFTSFIAYLQQKAEVYDVADALVWLSGSLAHADWQQVPLLLPVLALAGGWLLSARRQLRLFSLGDEAAIGLGVKVERLRLCLVLALVTLVSFATAATGPIAFVSFLAGPIVARLVGRTDLTLLLPAAYMGAVLVLGAELIGQHLLPTRLPVGVVTGLVGAPYLLAQLIRFNKQGNLA